MEWILLLLSLAITILAQAYINSAYKKTSKIHSKCEMKGSEVARKILDANGLFDVKINEINGELTDHYDPRNKTVNLSLDIYHDKTIAAASVAAHECGHAIQDKNGYLFLRVRRAIIPIVNIASKLGYVSILIGVFAGLLNFIWIGIILELVILLFQVITLPVEFNASRRALKQLEELSILDKKEKSQATGMLRAAALTYVASVATSLLQILRLLAMVQRRD